MESEKEGSSESEMEIGGESDEENSSESSEDSDVIDVQSDSARAGPNRHSGKISTCKVAHYHAVIIISCVLLLTSAGKVHTINLSDNSILCKLMGVHVFEDSDSVQFYFGICFQFKFSLSNINLCSTVMCQ